MSVTALNLEEAATIASEFIYSLDNLPNEIQHLLKEIRHKESRSQELQQEIDKDYAKYIRHQLRASPVPPSPTPSTPVSQHPKSQHLPAKISAAYNEIDQLASEKCLLSQQIIDLVTRTRSRLEVDIAKVRILQGEAVDYPTHHTKSIGGAVGTGGAAGYATGRNPALQITESLRNALANSPSISDVSMLTPPQSVAPASFNGPSANKKRRLTSTASMKLSSSPAASPGSSTPTSTTVHGAQQRSRLSRQIHPPRPADEDDLDMDAEGEDDVDGEADGDDEKLYCICQKQSYGDMIACDNEGDCPYEWFHLSCVNMKQPTPETWYCPACVSKGVGTGGRKGRKK